MRYGLVLLLMYIEFSTGLADREDELHFVSTATSRCWLNLSEMG